MQTLSVRKINKYLYSVKKGDLNSLTKLFEYTYSNLYKVAQMYLKNSNDVDDILSKTYVNVVKYIYTFNTSMNGYNWLFTIVKNCAKEFNKGESRRLEINCTIDDKIEDEFDPLEYILIRDAINTLSDYEKKLLEQIYWQGFTVKEVSNNSGIPITTLYSQLNSIYKKIRRYYNMDS